MNRWYNKPVKRAARLSVDDYGHYFKHNVSITTSGFYSTQGLEFWVNEIGADRCMSSIGNDSPPNCGSRFCNPKNRVMRFTD